MHGQRTRLASFDAFSPLAPHTRAVREPFDPRPLGLSCGVRRAVFAGYLALVFLCGVQAFRAFVWADGAHFGLARSPAAFDPRTVQLEFALHLAREERVDIVDEPALRRWLAEVEDRWRPRPLPSPLPSPLWVEFGRAGFPIGVLTLRAPGVRDLPIIIWGHHLETRGHELALDDSERDDLMGWLDVEREHERRRAAGRRPHGPPE